ncbi:MAG: NAD(P)-dependent alcohol dehydrogenase [Candidatus Thorarchaeota archaeon]
MVQPFSRGISVKAIVWTKYGSPEVLVLREVEKPTPKDNEILIKVHAAAVTMGDCEMRDLKLPLSIRYLMRVFVGIRKPKRRTILGQDLSGEIEAVGSDVTRFKKGDYVFGTTGFKFGAYAEYIALPADNSDGVLALKPTNITHEEAAAVVTGGLNALHFLRKANVQPGQKILIIGAGGSIGTVAVQLARSYGAEVTAIDSTKKLEMLGSIGADYVIDYTQEDYTKRGEAFDIVFDVIGKGSLSSTINSVKPGGVYLMSNPRLTTTIRGRWVSMRSSKKVVGGTADEFPNLLSKITRLMEAGTIKAVIDRAYPLEQTAEAHRYVETGHKVGNVVISLANSKKA